MWSRVEEELQHVYGLQQNREVGGKEGEKVGSKYKWEEKVYEKASIHWVKNWGQHRHLLFTIEPTMNNHIRLFLKHIAQTSIFKNCTYRIPAR